MARSTVQECLARVVQAGLAWPLPEALDDTQLEQQLYPSKPTLIEIPWPTLLTCIASLHARASPASCSGKSTKRNTRMGCNTARSVIAIASREVDPAGETTG